MLLSFFSFLLYYFHLIFFAYIFLSFCLFFPFHIPYLVIFLFPSIFTSPLPFDFLSFPFTFLFIFLFPFLLTSPLPFPFLLLSHFHHLSLLFQFSLASVFSSSSFSFSFCSFPSCRVIAWSVWIMIRHSFGQSQGLPGWGPDWCVESEQFAAHVHTPLRSQERRGPEGVQSLCVFWLYSRNWLCSNRPAGGSFLFSIRTLVIFLISISQTCSTLPISLTVTLRLQQ